MLGYHGGRNHRTRNSRGCSPSRIFKTASPEKQLLRASQDRRAENEGWRVRKNGTRLWADVIITALEGEAGCRRGFAVVMQDVTDRRKAAIELEAVRQERMTLQEQFLSHVSHELRTPLTAIYFFITNLLEGVNGDLSAGQRETLESSLENINQLKDMVSDLLDISRVDALKLTVDSPAHVCAGTDSGGSQDLPGECQVEGYQFDLGHYACSPFCMGRPRPGTSSSDKPDR